MTDQDYAEFQLRLMAHQTLLCAILATHQNKEQFAVVVTNVIDQMQSQLLSSGLDDRTLEIFAAEIQSILSKAGIAVAGN